MTYSGFTQWVSCTKILHCRHLYCSYSYHLPATLTVICRAGFSESEALVQGCDGGTTSLHFLPHSLFALPSPSYPLFPFPSPSPSLLPFPFSHPIPFSPILFLPLSTSRSPTPLVQAGGLGSTASSPSWSGRSLVAKWFVMHFELKRAFPVIAIYTEFSHSTTLLSYH